METTWLDVLKGYAQAVGWGVGIVVSLAGVLFAYWKFQIESKQLDIDKRKLDEEHKRLELDERKLLHDERIQKRKDWKACEHIYSAVVEVCADGAFAEIPIEGVRAFALKCEDARTLFPLELRNYVFEIRKKALEAATLRRRLKKYKGPDYSGEPGIRERIKMIIETLDELEAWFNIQLQEEVSNDLRPVRRLIDSKFYPFMGIE
jgi:hypothetical protein